LFIRFNVLNGELLGLFPRPKPHLFLPTSEVQGECGAELARALLNRSLHSQFYIAKLQKITDITKGKGEKNKNKCRIIWKLLKFFLSLQRQK
jgi:hypothetical protein